MLIMAKFVTAAEAVQQIKDGSMLATSGFVGGLLAEAVLKEIQASFKANGTPKDLSIVYAAGQGDSGERGLNHLGEEGLMKRIIGGHFNLSPRLGELINNNKVEAYNLPQGTISQWFRDIAGRRPVFSIPVLSAGLYPKKRDRLGYCLPVLFYDF